MDDDSLVDFTFGDAVRIGRSISSFEHQILVPRPQRQLNIPAQWSITPMIVTEVSKNSQIGTGQNIAIDNRYDSGTTITNDYMGTFEAKPYVLGVTSIDKLEGEAIRVASRMIASVLFTGQLFFCCTTGEMPLGATRSSDTGTTTTEDADGDVISGANGYRWTGKYTTDIRGVDNVVDVDFVPLCANPKATSDRRKTCRIFGSNETGTALANTQKLILDYLATPCYFGTGSTRWRISEYECLPV